MLFISAMGPWTSSFMLDHMTNTRQHVGISMRIEHDIRQTVITLKHCCQFIDIYELTATLTSHNKRAGETCQSTTSDFYLLLVSDRVELCTKQYTIYG